MTKQVCMVCNKPLGMMTSKMKFTDGVICMDCLKQLVPAEAIKVKTLAKYTKGPIDQFLNAYNINRVICPYCGSDQIEPIGANKQAFSFGKAVGGAVLTGGIGVLAGFAGKKTGKTDWACKACGKQFTK